MVRAIALLALLETIRHGCYRASFSGFSVNASRRTGSAGSGDTIDVHLTIALGGRAVERAELRMDDDQVKALIDVLYGPAGSRD